jgi:hypothetical protein
MIGVMMSAIPQKYAGLSTPYTLSPAAALASTGFSEKVGADSGVCTALIVASGVLRCWLEVVDYRATYAVRSLERAPKGRALCMVLYVQVNSCASSQLITLVHRSVAVVDNVKRHARQGCLPTVVQLCNHPG